MVILCYSLISFYWVLNCGVALSESSSTLRRHRFRRKQACGSWNPSSKSLVQYEVLEVSNADLHNIETVTARCKRNDKPLKTCKWSKLARECPHRLPCLTQTVAMEEHLHTCLRHRKKQITFIVCPSVVSWKCTKGWRMMDHKNVLRRLLHEKDGESEMNSQYCGLELGQISDDKG